MFNKFREITSSCLVGLALLLTISYSQSIDYLSPNSGDQNVNDLEVHLYTNGVNYYDPYSYNNVYFSGSGISTSYVYYLGSNHFKFYVDINSNAETDNRDVYLNVNGLELVKYDGFTVTENTSGITSISPSEVQAGGEYQINIYASGVNFTDPYMNFNFSGGGIDITNTQVYSDWIQTTIQVDLLTSTYARDLTVNTGVSGNNGYSYTLEGALTITEPDPIEIVSISPNSGYQGTDDLSLDITLNNLTFLDTYSNASLIFSGEGITMISHVGIDDFDNIFEANIDIASWTDIGTYDVTLNLSWQESMSTTLYEGFTVNESDWELVSLDPNDSYPNVENQNLILYGSNTNWGCCGPTQLVIEGSGISVDWVEVNNPEQLTAQIDISQWASHGYRDVTVINGYISSGSQSVSLQGGFHVKPPDAILSPDEGYPGDAFEVNVIGGGVSFNDIYGTANIYFSGSNLTVSNINLTSENSYTFYLSIGDADPGMHDLYINHNYGSDYSFDDVFEVLSLCDDVDGDDICDEEDDCVGAYDECSVCNGDGIADGACDCAGNVEDCAGECGGNAELDDCGVCNGDGTSCEVPGCMDDTALNYNPDAIIDDGSCDYLAILSFGNIIRDYENDHHYIEILLDNPNSNLRGFQFTLTSSPVTLYIQNVSGGLSETAGFEINYNVSNHTVIGYDLEGGSIMEEEGVLTSLDLFGNVDAYPTEVCIVDEILIGPTGDNQYTSDVGDCFTIENEIGDVNEDGNIDVLDVVMIVNFALGFSSPGSYEGWAADINADGTINIQDIVMEIDIILGTSDLARVQHLQEAEIDLFSDKMTVSSDGTIAGVELHTSGDFTITSSALPEGWEFYQNNDIILLVDMVGTGISEDITLYYDGTMQIKNSLLSDWSGNGISASLNIIPDTYILESAYPNPFNPVTTIGFALPEDGNVAITIYNMAGQQVYSLVSDNKDAGYHTAVWNASEQSSGVYFVKMVAGDYISTQKLMLIK